MRRGQTGMRGTSRREREARYDAVRQFGQLCGGEERGEPGEHGTRPATGQYSDDVFAAEALGADDPIADAQPSADEYAGPSVALFSQLAIGPTALAETERDRIGGRLRSGIDGLLYAHALALDAARSRPDMLTG